MDFDKGVTKISGPNESGKSLLFEMIRYALFGSKALRGEAADYKAVWVELVFTVAGQQYTITRTSKDAVLKKDDDFLARSTTAVNTKIIEILGYGLTTFDNINSIGQAEIEKLTKLAAKDRKKFTDELIGASQIDELIKEYKAEADIEKASLDALAMGLLSAEEPKKPVGYRPLAEINAELVEIRARLRTFDALTVQHSAVEEQLARLAVTPDPLEELTLEAVEASVASVEANQAELKTLVRQHPDIARMVNDGVEIKDFGTFLTACADMKEANSLVRPKLSLQEIEATQDKWKQLHAWNRLTEVRRLLSEMDNCPRCGLSFDEEKAPLVEEANKLEPYARPHRSLPSEESLVEAREGHAKWEALKAKVDKVHPDYVIVGRYCAYDPSFTEQEFRQVSARIKELSAVSDFSELYASLSSKKLKAQRQELIDKRDALTTELQGMDPTEGDALLELKHSVGNYEMQAQYYEKIRAKNAEIEAKMVKVQATLDTKKGITKALNDFKYYVNTYFLPKVAKAASSMLSTMTNGARRRVFISDKFDIIVDGQNVNTLSGSAKALVNISLRLAFQYVLTRNNFSVFMGDEIDASMDEHRAKYLSECLGSIKDHIDQIIVISHREIVADNTITL